ncbi:MAG: hypothetical protein KKA05_02735, partial [Alphaproteobacteria bacterium]|nr:hypothetical protein [Alphaproteobacteria bacterium]
MKYDNMKSRTLLAALMVGCVLTLGACTSQTVSGKPLTELSFDHVQPLFISASRVDVTNNYAPGADDKDVSSRLPTPPDMAVRRWAEKRLQAANGVGIMHFSIDSATVHQQNFGPETTLERWT